MEFLKRSNYEKKKMNAYFPIPTFRAWHCGVWKQKQPPFERAAGKQDAEARQ